MIYTSRASSNPSASIIATGLFKLRRMELLETPPPSQPFEARLSWAVDRWRNKHPANSVMKLAKELISQDGTMGVSRQAIYGALRGDSKSLTAENVARAARTLGVDMYWLATGDGSPFDVSRAPRRLTTDEALGAMGAVLRGLPPRVRPAVAANLSGWATEGGAAHYEAALVALLATEDGARGKRAGNGQ